MLFLASWSSCEYIASKRGHLPVHKVSAWVRFTVQSVGRHDHEHGQEGQKSQAELDIDLAFHDLSNYQGQKSHTKHGIDPPPTHQSQKRQARVPVIGPPAL